MWGNAGRATCFPHVQPASCLALRQPYVLWFLPRLWFSIPGERGSIRIVHLLRPVFSNNITINLLPLPVVILFHLLSSQQIALSLKLEHEFTYLARVAEPQKATGLLEWVEIQKIGPDFIRRLGQGMFLWFCEAMKQSGCSVHDSLTRMLERFAFRVKAFISSDFFFLLSEVGLGSNFY